ncbi:hypothetical protein ACFVS9_28275 [Streptomyces sp. NPDC058008]|uniref:hypothetical protein n=1 Tax=Streptomyces sp. NPDC058008 TaxID=3346303 RepID=UPI0036ED8183
MNPTQPDTQVQIDAQIQQFRAAINDATRIPTFHRDDSKLPTIGDAQPVPQPGRPPMTQRAVDLNTTILTSSVLVGVLGASTTAVLWGSGQADPTVIAWVCGCVVGVPAALTLPVLALKSLMKSAKEVAQAAPAPVHHHYNGNITVDQRSIHANTRGIIANTRNELP